MVRRLLAQGHEVVGVDDLSTGLRPEAWSPPLEANPRWTLHFGDVRDYFRDAAHERFDEAWHFAAVVGGRSQIEGNPLLVARDLAIDADFFYWATQARPQRILFASSSAAYPVDQQGDGHAVPLHEGLIDFAGRLGTPDLTYGWSKLTGEYLASIAARHHGLSVAVVRPFSGYGEEQEEVYPVPAIAGRAARREDPLVVWGSGRQSRDFVHIDDCVDAMQKAIALIHDGRGINIGSGVATSFLEVAACFASIAGYDPQIVAQIDQPTGVFARFADPTRAREVLGFTPQISLRQGLERVYEAALKRTLAATKR